MRLLLDTNIYARLAEQGGTEEVALRLRSRRDVVRATSVIWQEIIRAPLEERASRWRVVFALATEFPPAGAELDAREVRLELRRLRPGWLLRDPDLRGFTRAQRFNRENWRAVRYDPSWAPPRLEEYESDARSGMDYVQANHRARKQQLEPRELPPEALEVLWRREAAAVWMGALGGNSWMRDYADFLAPFMNAAADVTDVEWYRFWLQDVRGDNVPRNRAMGVASHFQATRKTSRGQAMDTLHAAELPSVDAIVTTDSNFADAIDEVAAALPRSGCAIRVSSVRTADSVLAALPPRR